MIPVLFAAIASLGIAGDLRLDVEAEARSLARSADYTEVDDVARIETTLVPRLALRTDGRLQVRLAWEPTMLLPVDVVGETIGLEGTIADRTILLHRVAATGELALPRWRILAGGSAQKGETLLVADPAAGRVAQAVSTTARLPYFGAEANLGARWEPGQRTTLEWSVGASQSGGEGTEGRTLLPRFRTVRAAAGARRNLDPRNEVGLELAGTRSRVGDSAARDAGFLRGGARWAHQATRHLDFRTAAGVALTWERDLPDPEALEGVPPVLPWVEGSLGYALEGSRPRFDLGVSVAPAVDRFRGTLDLLASAWGAVGWSPFRRWTFGLRASTASSFGWRGEQPEASEPHTMVHGATASASYRILDDVRLAASAGTTWQITEREDLPTFREDLVTIEIVAALFSL